MTKYFSSLVEQSRSRATEATLSILGISNPELRRHLALQMNADSGSDGGFLSDPVFEHTFGWESSNSSMEELVNEGLLSKQLIAALDDKTNGRYAFRSHWKPFTHQLRSWSALLKENKSIVVTSGTGSGKTECFMVPVLEDLHKEYIARNKQRLVGVRALFLYPLNALINSQKERLNAWTKAFDGNIRFCLYNGNTKELHASVRTDQRASPNEILSRELLREEPAPILVTNGTMLEYMMVRQIDAPIVQKSKEEKSLRWIILDEAHSYVGSQAAELALQLRRVLNAFGVTSNDVQFIATSATIAGDEAEHQLKKFLHDLSGVPESQIDVIGGTRAIPNLEKMRAEDVSLDELEQFAEEELEKMRSQGTTKQSLALPGLFQKLNASTTARAIRHCFVSNSKSSPLRLDELRQQLGRQSKAELDNQTLLRWLDLCTAAKPSADEQAFLKLRAHFFQRTTHGLWSCVDRNCSSKNNSELSDSWPFGYVYVNQRQTCHCGAPVYELSFCNDCNEPHLLARDKKGQLVQWQTESVDEFSLQDATGVEDVDSQDSREERAHHPLVIASKDTTSEDYISCFLEKATAKTVLDSDDAIEIRLNQIEEKCSASDCGFSGYNNSSPFRRALLGGPFYVANVVPMVLEYCPDFVGEDDKGKKIGPQSLPGRGRRLITFTDSRQGTARMSVRMQQEAERSRLRGALVEVLSTHQRTIATVQKPKADVNIDDLKAKYEAASKESQEYTEWGLPIEAEEANKRATRLKKILDELMGGASIDVELASLSWTDSVSELKEKSDFNGSMLIYNKEYKPEIFEDNAGPTKLADMLLFREFMRRPKRQNSLETQGLVKVSYQGLDKVTHTPIGWKDKQLTLDDWKAFLKVSLDFYVRENNFIPLEDELRNWIGSRFSSKRLRNPDSKEEDEQRIKRWPQIRNGRQNNHRLVKLLILGAKLSPKKTEDIDLVNAWLKEAWTQLSSSQQLGILKSDGNQFYLPREKMTFSLLTKAYVCPVTNKLLDTAFRGLTPYLPNRLDFEQLTPVQMKKLHVEEVALPAVWKFDKSQFDYDEGISHIRNQVSEDNFILNLRNSNLWTDINDRAAEGGFYYRTAEHSAQQSSERLESYEEMFKSGKVNVLNCSTTMEMGVDIGGISAVVMNNVPPHPANYLQRAGRAGRSQESRAIAYTLCKNNPHDQQVFSNPNWPWNTIIAAPAVTLNSERLVQRHLNSLLLSEFLCNEIGDMERERTKLTTHWFFNDDNGESICERFIVWLKSAVLNCDSAIDNLVKNTALQGRSPDILRKTSIAAIEKLQTRWLSEYRYLTTEIKASKHKSPYRKRLEKELQRHGDEYLLRDLAARTFLPGYGFPTDVVSFDNFTIEDYIREIKGKEKGKYDREDNVSRYKGLPSRNLAVAIREYAPGAEIVLDGRVFKSAGVSLHWHNLNADTNEAQKIDLAWRCDACGELGYEEGSARDELLCSNQDCQTPIKITNTRSVLQPSGFVTDCYEAPSNNIEQQRFMPVEPSWVFVNSNRVLLPNPAMGFMSSGVDGHVFHQSLGEHGHGYALCMACGRAESMHSSDDAPAGFADHFPPRPTKDDKDDNNKRILCQGGSHYLTNITLGTNTNTDVFELVLRHPVSGEYLKDSSETHRTIATTLVVALRKSLAEILGIAVSEIGYSFRPVRLESGESVLAMQLYDDISGGAGFSSSAPEYIETLITGMVKNLNCDHCDSSCSECLLDVQSRHDFDKMDRLLTLNWLGSDFTKYIFLADHENLSIPGGRYSPGSIESAIHKYLRGTHQTITLWLRGNLDDWDLTAPEFKISVRSFLMRDITVNLVIPSKIECSDIEEELARLSSWGATINTSNLEENSPVLVQICSPNETITLASKFSPASVPGKRWHQAEQIVIITEQLEPYDLYNMEMSSWRKIPSGNLTEDIAILDQLNGAANQFGEAFWQVIIDRLPMVSELFANQSIIQATYSDRYIQNPASVALLGTLFYYLKDKMAVNATLHVNTLFKSGKNTGTLTFHDWNNQNDFEYYVSEWLDKKTGLRPNLKVFTSNSDVAHSRKLQLYFDNGATLKLRFDQGMGYWKLYFQPRTFRFFDFTEEVKHQLIYMDEAFAEANVFNSEQKWATDVLVEFSPG